MSTIKVNIHSSQDAGDPADWAEFEFDQALKERISFLLAALLDAGADFIEQFSYHLTYHWYQETRTDNTRLVISRDGDFWWEGNYKHCDIKFSTDPIKLVELSIDQDADKREYIETIEE